MINKDAFQGYRPPENEQKNESAGVVAARKLMEAKIGDTVEVTVKMLGPLALAHMQGVKPTFDEDGKISVDLQDVKVGSMGRDLTFIDSGEYGSTTEFLFRWSGQVFMDNFRAAVNRALAQQKKSAFDKEVVSSLAKRVSTATRYLQEGIGYREMQSFFIMLRQSVRVALTGETPFHDRNYSKFAWGAVARESMESSFEADETDISVHEGTDKGEKTLLATLKITKKGELLVSQAELEEFLYELNY